MAEQRYQAALAVISDGLSVSQVAQRVGVSRRTLHSWLARYEAEGLEGLADRSHRPASCAHQMPAATITRGCLRAEFPSERTAFTNLKTAQRALDEWVVFYNTERPHQAIDMRTPAERFAAGPSVTPTTGPASSSSVDGERSGSDWISRRVTTNGVVCVSWQQVSIGRHYAGSSS